MCRVLALLAVCAVAGSVVRADEIRLKDGSKIVGTIVGFEDGAFKVETAYGFAMVRKASIVEIVPTDPAKSAEVKDEPKPAAKPASAPVPKLARPPRQARRQLPQQSWTPSPLRLPLPSQWPQPPRSALPLRQPSLRWQRQ